MVVLQPRTCRNSSGLGSSPFARRYLGNHYCFLFLLVLRCFSSQSLPPFQDLIAEGLPHSEISGSKAVCASPKLIAAYHVLLRLHVPRHPPYTLLFFLPLQYHTFVQQRAKYAFRTLRLILFSVCQFNVSESLRITKGRLDCYSFVSCSLRKDL